MNKGLQVALFTIGGIVAMAALLLIGVNFGRAVAFSSDNWWEGVSTLRTAGVYPYRGSMMGEFSFGSESSMMEMMGGQSEIAESAIGPAEAVEIAQRYLDAYLPGAEAEDTPDPFYGYYTLHIGRDGNVVGMLSVNGTTGQVWPHTWHGESLDVSDHD